MTLATVVIWYNPDSESVKNIIKYSSLVKTIYIVDNSKNNNENFATQIPNSVYIPNFSNLGIAKALNIGCSKAYNDGFEWCMTMDQDSSWDEDKLKRFIASSEENISDTNLSFAPRHSNSVKSMVGNIKAGLEKDNESKILYPSKVMTSGNIISLKVWKEVKGFNEDLFIDEVDHEFCYKLTTLGYKICEFQDIFMYHTLGQAKKTILPRPCKHSGVRLFYIFRNMLYIKKEFPNEFKNNRYKRYMTFAIIQKIFELKFKDLKYIHMGKKAYKKNIYGSFENFLLFKK